MHLTMSYHFIYYVTFFYIRVRRHGMVYLYVKKHWESASDEYNLLQMNLLYMHSCNLIRENLIFVCQEFLMPVFF